VAFGNADSYARFMGRFSEPLAPEFALAVRDVRGRVLDVGCGPGVLTDVLARRYGPGRVDAIDPTPGFVEAARSRLPGVDVRLGTAEELPYGDGAYEVAFAQLVVHFMKDPVRGLSEMARVARGGLVAACVWDHGGGRGPLSPFWDAVAEIDPEEHRERSSAGSTEGDLTRLFGEAGVVDVVESTLSVTIHLDSFEEWWAPFEEGVGTVGDYLARHRDQIGVVRDKCRDKLGDGPFEVEAAAWCAIGRSPSSR
jgi:SAM-dependent methyltransferase